MSRQVDDINRSWLKLNRAAEEVAFAVVTDLGPLADESVAVGVNYSFLLKAARTLRGLNLLMSQRLYEQSEVLARVLFELRVTYDVFIQRFLDDPDSATRRVLDSMMLEKYKQARASGVFRIQGGPVKADWDKLMTKIDEQYSASELASIKKKGFTGLSVEERAKRAGHLDTYNIIYRNFSRNVHSTDYMEHLAPRVFGKEFDKYVGSRSVVISSVAHVSALGVAEALDNLFLDGQREPRFAQIAERRRKLNEATKDG